MPARPNRQMPRPQPSLVPLHLFAFALLAALAVPATAQLFRGPLPAQVPNQASPAAQPQATLPPTPPTTLPAANSLPAPLAATPDGPTGPPHRAIVTFASGNLNVRANNSSLHQILRSIARQTGMTISGGVADQRVFGDYGPADPAAVLATLLDGTGVNMLLRQDENQTPVQLILTPRTGEGPTAPAMDIADTADDTPLQPQPGQPVLTGTAPLPRQPDGPVSIPQPDNNINGSPSNTSPTASTFPTTNSVPIDSIPTPSTTPSTTGIVDAPNPPPPGSTTSTSPNGVATPDQIYQQLLKLQQQRQQQQQQGTTPTPTPPPQ